MNNTDGIGVSPEKPESYVIHSSEEVKPPINDDARIVLEMAMVGARENFSQDSSCSPCILMTEGVTTDGQTKVHVVGFREFTEKTKDQVGKFLPAARRDHDAIAFVVESWMAAMPPGSTKEDIRSGNFIRASLSPNRKEVVMINLFDLTRSLMVVAEIKRPDKAKPFLGDWEVYFDTIKSGCQLEGRLAG